MSNTPMTREQWRGWVNETWEKCQQAAWAAREENEMNPDLIRLIEANGLTLHGDIEHFAHLVAEAEREACCKILDELHHLARGDHNLYLYAANLLRERK